MIGIGKASEHRRAGSLRGGIAPEFRRCLTPLLNPTLAAGPFALHSRQLAPGHEREALDRGRSERLRWLLLIPGFWI